MANQVHNLVSGGGTKSMLYYTLLFLLLALVAAFLGFWAVAGLAAIVSKVLFFLFLALFLFSLVSKMAKKA
jgi:uncharacterized membrane protein YtjA (UPF0391 family)